MKRAYRTAVSISKLIGTDVITVTGIREIYAGKWQQMTFDDLENKFPNEYRVWLNDIGNARCNDGESVKELSERVMASLTVIAEENDGKVKEVLEYYIENKNKWNKRWWEEKEVEYQELYDAIANNDINYIQRYKKDKKRKTCIELGIRGI